MKRCSLGLGRAGMAGLASLLNFAVSRLGEGVTIMYLSAIAVAFLVAPAAEASPAADFAGNWKVTKVVEGDDEFSWSREVKYPAAMTLEFKNGVLAGHYTDQWDYSSSFELVAVVNQGHDLILVHSGGTKDPASLSPIHHVKLVDGKLHGIVTTHMKLFEWIAERP